MRTAIIFGHYQIFENGQVVNTKTQKNPSLFICNGYPSVGISNQTRHLHRLLALAFIPNPENKPQVNHKNGIKTDFRLENLEWATAQENIQHAYSTGLMKYAAREPRTKSAKTKTPEVRLITPDIQDKIIYSVAPPNKLATELNCSETEVRRIRSKFKQARETYFQELINAAMMTL